MYLPFSLKTHWRNYAEVSSKSLLTALQYYFKRLSTHLMWVSVNRQYILKAVYTFFFSPAIWKTLELKKLTNRNQGFKSQPVNQQDTTRAEKKFSRYLSNRCYFSNMFSTKPLGKWQWRHLIWGAIWKVKKLVEFLIFT